MLDGGNGNDILIGGSGDDILIGGGGDDVLFGNDGKDQIQGGSGDDELTGGKGDDELTGGQGNDTYIFDKSANQGSDSIEEYANQGYRDTLVGAGLSGLEVNLFITTPQLFYDLDHNLILTITLAVAGQVEYSY
jgi:Ca2+-binding RTX toxin-like protein